LKLHRYLLKKAAPIINGLMQSSIPEIDDGKESTAEFQRLCRKVAAESCVLLKNDGTLPVKDKKVSVFGRTQIDYFYVGYGSGGDVKAPYRVSLIEGLKNTGMDVYKPLENEYRNWVKNNPTETGFWGYWPSNHEEMPVSKEMIQEAHRNSEVAIVVIGRAAGEDKDNKLKKGQWFLTNQERELLSNVTAQFDQVCVVLNSGSIMDLSWIEEYQINAVLYAWMGGQESGNGVADILSGKVSPSGKLPDTIADYKNYPSSENFGGRRFDNYTEDIYVGYRYFETFAKEKVKYPFGYGLSYTTFSVENTTTTIINDAVNITATVTNTGNLSGKEVIQIYFEAPQGKLGKPLRSLAAYKKTKQLEPGETEEVKIAFPVSEMASFDDIGITGHANAFVLEEGQYSIYIGTDVRSAKKVKNFFLEFQLVKQFEEACPVEISFERMVNRNGLSYETVPTRSIELKTRILAALPEEISRTEDKGIKLVDVKNKKHTMEEFVAQLSLEELEALVRGADEGMYSPKGVPGNAGVMAATTEALTKKGIPTVSTNDGPSGLRIQAHSTLLPIGIALASTFDDHLIEEITIELGREMQDRNSQVLLAPGMNIHRNPLCGRNFEYFSEDPHLSGKIAAAYVRGVQSTGGSAVIKHFACNNQEKSRHSYDARVSPRSLREIYLKGFEICINDSNPHWVMTSYNKINGVSTYYNYDLVTQILRKDWGYKGCVMTDWWIKTDKSPDFKNIRLQAYRIRAQVDVFMPGSANIGLYKGKSDGSLLKSLSKQDGITLGEIQRSAVNILNYCIKYII
jgi:beta-glucosidase